MCNREQSSNFCQMSFAPLNHLFRVTVGCAVQRLPKVATLQIGKKRIHLNRPSGSTSFPAGHFLHQRFESRVAAQIVEHWIDLDDEKIIAVAALISALQLSDRALLLAQAEINQRDRIWRDITRLCQFV